MIVRCLKFLIAIVLSCTFTISLEKLVICVWNNVDTVNKNQADVMLWLNQNQLGKYYNLFREHGKLTFFFYGFFLFPKS